MSGGSGPRWAYEHHAGGGGPQAAPAQLWWWPGAAGASPLLSSPGPPHALAGAGAAGWSLALPLPGAAAWLGRTHAEAVPQQGHSDLLASVLRGQVQLWPPQRQAPGLHAPVPFLPPAAQVQLPPLELQQPVAPVPAPFVQAHAVGGQAPPLQAPPPQAPPPPAPSLHPPGLAAGSVEGAGEGASASRRAPYVPPIDPVASRAPPLAPVPVVRPMARRPQPLPWSLAPAAAANVAVPTTATAPAEVSWEAPLRCASVQTLLSLTPL